MQPRTLAPPPHAAPTPGMHARTPTPYAAVGGTGGRGGSSDGGGGGTRLSGG